MQGCMDTKKLLRKGTNGYSNPDACLLAWLTGGVGLEVLYNAGKLKISRGLVLIVFVHGLCVFECVYCNMNVWICIQAYESLYASLNAGVRVGIDTCIYSRIQVFTNMTCDFRTSEYGCMYIWMHACKQVWELLSTQCACLFISCKWWEMARCCGAKNSKPGLCNSERPSAFLWKFLWTCINPTSKSCFLCFRWQSWTSENNRH